MLGWQQVKSIPTSSRISRQLDVSKEKTRPLSRMSVLGLRWHGLVVAPSQQPRGGPGMLSEASVSAWACFVSECAEGWQCKQAGSCGSFVRKSDVRKRRQLHDAHYPFPSIKRQKTINLFLHWHSYVRIYCSWIRAVTGSRLSKKGRQCTKVGMDSHASLNYNNNNVF